MKKINETRFERIYADNRLKQFRTRNIENSSTKQVEIHEILNTILENSIDAMLKSNIHSQNVRVIDEVRNGTARDAVEKSDVNDQVFEYIIVKNNLLSLKIRNVYMIVKSSTRHLDRLIQIEHSLNSVDRRTSTTTFTIMNEILIEKKIKCDKGREF